MYTVWKVVLTTAYEHVYYFILLFAGISLKNGNENIQLSIIRLLFSENKNIQPHLGLCHV